MIDGARETILIDYQTRLRAAQGRLRVDEYLREREINDDNLLADLIALDGRTRLELGLTVSLEDYLRTVPDLASRTVPLDAAIEATLRADRAFHASLPDAAEELIRRHPELETIIREAMVIGSLLTQAGAGDKPPREPLLKTPCDFGPPIESGEPRYILRSRLGAGVQGEVYLAVDRKLSDGSREALVAIKLLRRSTDPWARRRFIEEAAKARRIDHPNVVRVIDRGEHEDRDFIVFEYVEGGTLDEHAHSLKRPLRPEEAVAFAAAIARGVQAAHAAGLVHADLKPGNILVSRAGVPKVADFGVADRYAADADAAPMQGNLAFMAPEQFRMEPGARSHLVDIYAVGGMLYWMLTGLLPHGESMVEIARAHREGLAPPSPAAAAAIRGVRIDADLDAVCRRAMAREPSKRHQSVGSLADDLEAWSRRQPIPWTKPSRWRTASLYVRRNPAGVAVVGALVLVTAASVAIAASSRARLNATQAALADAEARYADERRFRENAEQIVMTELVRLDELTREGFLDQSLAELWVYDTLFGPSFVNYEHGHALLLAERSTFLERLLKVEHDAGRGHEHRATLLLTALAYWTLTSGDPEGAAPMLDDAAARWLNILPPDDSHHLFMDALRAGAAVAILERDNADAPRDRLAALEQRILAAERSLSVIDGDMAARKYLLNRLVWLYAPERLDRPERAAEYAEIAARRWKP